MKQMSLAEADDSLKGRCIPSDSKVNEVNAEYFVRKFGELESKLGVALRERSSAGITISNLEVKCAKMAVENTPLRQSEKESSDLCREGFSEWEDGVTGTPTTDTFLAEVRAQGVNAAIEATKNLVAQEYEYKDFKATQGDCCMHPGSDLVGEAEMTEWLVDFATQLRKEGNQ